MRGIIEANPGLGTDGGWISERVRAGASKFFAETHRSRLHVPVFRRARQLDWRIRPYLRWTAPVLGHQAFPKEGPYQRNLADRIGLSEHRFNGRATERATPPYEPSSRTRSLMFFAYGALAAAMLGGQLFVPENGLISINPPLTSRSRCGSSPTL